MKRVTITVKDSTWGELYRRRGKAIAYYTTAISFSAVVEYYLVMGMQDSTIKNYREEIERCRY